MVPNQGMENNAISLDEEELRRLLEQPISEDDPERAAFEAGDQAMGLEPSDLAEAGALDGDDDLGSTATGLASVGSAATGSQSPLGQDTIDQLLAQARDEAAKSAPVSAAATPREAPPSPAPSPPKPASTPSRPASSIPKAPSAPGYSTGASPKAPVTVQPVEFSPLGVAAARRDKSPLSDLGILLDVPLRITVELGRAEMSVREILSLGPGSVIELDRSAGEVLDVLVNGTLVAQGEVVVVDEQFGIRLTHVFSPNKDILEGMGAE